MTCDFCSSFDKKWIYKISLSMGFLYHFYHMTSLYFEYRVVTKTSLGPPPYIQTPDVNLCYDIPHIMNHSLANLRKNTFCKHNFINSTDFWDCFEELRAYSPKEL